MTLISGDGAARLAFPILASYVGDYPEQVLVTLVKTGECPVCDEPRDGLGEPGVARPPRNNTPILDALNTISKGAQAFTRACSDAGIRPVQEPFWKDLPYVNIYSSITPDILHQLYQGFIKHLISWIKDACSSDELDA